MSHQLVIVSGRLSKDPETKTSASGTTVTNFAIPVNYKRQGEEATEWFNIKSFGKTAEFVAEYFTKGKPAEVHGRLQTEDWEDKDGNSRRSVWLLADRVFFLDGDTSEGGRADRGGGDEDRQQRTQAPRNATKPAAKPAQRKPAQRDPEKDDGDSGGAPW